MSRKTVRIRIVGGQIVVRAPAKSTWSRAFFNGVGSVLDIAGFGNAGAPKAVEFNASLGGGLASDRRAIHADADKALRSLVAMTPSAALNRP